MTIYVDELFTITPRTATARRFGNRWCHCFTDGDLEELHLFAKRLGLQRSHFQPHATLAHYDLIPSKRALAVKLGAKEVTTAERLRQAREKIQKETTPS